MQLRKGMQFLLVHFSRDSKFSSHHIGINIYEICKTYLKCKPFLLQDKNVKNSFIGKWKVAVSFTAIGTIKRIDTTLKMRSKLFIPCGFQNINSILADCHSHRILTAEVMTWQSNLNMAGPLIKSFMHIFIGYRLKGFYSNH